MVKKSTTRYERLLIERAGRKHILKLYVTGMTPRSTDAVAAVKAFCEAMMAGQYDLEIVDLYKNPERAAAEQVIASPTLVKKSPLPERKLIGNLTDRQRLMRGLELTPRG